MATTKYIKINEIAGKYKEGTLSIHTQSAAPTTAELTMYVASPADLPLVGQKLEVFRRDDVKLFNGNISEVDWVGAVEVGGYLEVKVSAVGKDDILYRRSTWLRLASRCTQFRSFAGNVDTNGSAVTLVDGTPFDKEMEGELIDPPVYTFGNKIKINDVEYPVASVDDPHHLTITGDAGVQTNVAYTRNITTDMALKYLLDKNCDWEGFTYDESSIAAGSVINGLLLFDPPIPVRDAIGKLLDLDPEFHFTCDVNQKCWYGPRTLAPAPLDFTDVTEAFKRGLRVTTTREDVRNIEINITNWDAVLPGDGDTGGIDTFTGDGEKRSWFTSKPIGRAVSCMFNGVEASFSDDANQDARFYYLPNGSAFWQNPLDPVMTGEDSVVFTYKPLAENMLEVIDEDACTLRRTIEGGGLGRYEQPMDRSQFMGKTDAYNSSVSSIARNRDNLIRASLRTFDDGYAVGQKVTISIADRGISEDMYIEEVTASDADTAGTVHDFEYTLTCISLERIVLAGESLSSLPPELIASTRRLTGVEILRSLFDIKGMTGGLATGGSSTVENNIGGGGGKADVVPLTEVPAGVRDGVNKTFTLSYIPRRNSISNNREVILTLNGNRLHPFSYFSDGWASPGGQYRMEDNKIILAFPPRKAYANEPADLLLATYWPGEQPQVEKSYPKTGIWYANPSAGYSAVRYPEWGEAANLAGLGGSATFTNSAPLREYDTYPRFITSGFLPPPNKAVVEAEWIQARVWSNFTQGVGVNGVGVCRILIPGRTTFTPVAGSGEIVSKDTTGELTLDTALQTSYSHEAYEFGVNSADGNTIWEQVLSCTFWYMVWQTLSQSYLDCESPAVLNALKGYFTLYYPGIRIACGGPATIPINDQLVASTDGSHKFIYEADKAYEGGQPRVTGRSGDTLERYAYERHGDGFSYTFGRSYFADYYPVCYYKLRLFFMETLYHEAGKRRFNVYVNDVKAISGLDPYDVHGVSAFVEEYSFSVLSWPDGKIYVRFEAEVGEAFVNAIKLEPALGPGM